MKDTTAIKLAKKVIEVLDKKCRSGCEGDHYTWVGFQNGNGTECGVDIERLINQAKRIIRMPISARRSGRRRRSNSPCAPTAPKMDWKSAKKLLVVSNIPKGYGKELTTPLSKKCWYGLVSGWATKYCIKGIKRSVAKCDARKKLEAIFINSGI